MTEEKGFYGLGSRSREMLLKAGYDSLEDVRQDGAVTTYLAVKKVWPGASLNLLWALHGAITGKHWQKVAREDREMLLFELSILEGRHEE